MKTLSYSLLVVASLLVGGCAAPTHRIEHKIAPTVVENKIDFIEADFSPVCTSYGWVAGCEAFFLNVRNLSDKPVEVNWNKTMFISGGQTSGGFMFEGVVYKDRNAPKSPDIVFAKGSVGKKIWPNNLVSFSSGKYGGWSHDKIPLGNVGVYLTVTVDGKDYSQKMTRNISQESVPIK